MASSEIGSRAEASTSATYCEVEFVVQLLEHRHQSLFVNDLLFRGEHFARFQFLQHVLKAGECQVWMLRLLAFAVLIEFLCDRANVIFLRFGTVWEREWIEHNDGFPPWSVF